jgi:3D (Asp-Asp-Asp) domain-containing protein
VVVGGVVQWRARDGTIAADTDSYPFGTRMFVPDWGWGVVEDRGGAIQVKTNELRDEM